ncbi:MAG: YbaB/EbfC family nucleoid-associated protein [Atopobiaceae bacterium]|nr:YbaB/EbfC family nucleoid-associated protein [Atopobiaceae bacterium]MCH4120204.1 YbaB/EbfC family nucleoid-associated protein [Atopobiaceae bacterium]MCI1389761.1 YbaB/EbfC family nucleoid-associated protein [Atopobiaceae bacterium]MCI1432481.1 YbaB/EbfC family nucleoid-associated protein [Atopobiaceae bacterium]MCI1471182.1 YbaB/EbfC family nucleoid-associated protein [Atopobiaceae bacterium]
MGGMNMQQVMKQARKMQEQLAEVQDGLKDIEVSSSVGGGMVKVTATADMKLTSITIDPEAVDPDDVEMLQDLVLTAVNDVLESAQDAANKQMGAVTGGLGIPGMM